MYVKSKKDAYISNQIHRTIGYETIGQDFDTNFR
jgi:hypothetical protein